MASVEERVIQLVCERLGVNKEQVTRQTSFVEDVGAGVTKTFGGVAAVLDASFAVSKGRTLGIVGESGSGKTTLARMIVGVENPDEGGLRWIGQHRVQLVHQNPLGAFDPRWTIGRSLREALADGGVPRSRRAAETRKRGAYK